MGVCMKPKMLFPLIRTDDGYDDTVPIVLDGEVDIEGGRRGGGNRM